MANQTLYTFKANLQELVKLQIELDKANAKLTGLKKNTAAYTAQQKAVGAAAKNVEAQTKAMAGATTQANKMNKAGGRLVNTFKSAAVAIGAAFAVRAITGSIRSIISTFTEFEAQMAAVKAISGATEQEFKQLESTALDLGASTVFTATQVAQLQEEFARLGFTVSEIDLATKSTLDLAAATGESLAKSAQIAGSTLRAFGLEASLTKNVTDVMAASFTSSALNLDRFTESMKFVAPVARAAGFTLEETTAILGNLANNGIAGSIAGNGLKNILLRLADANSKLSKKLGGTVQGIPQLTEALKKLSEEGFSATDAVELLDKRSAPAFLALINNIDGLQDSVNILNNAEGAVTKMAAIRLDTLQGDFTILKSASEGLSIALGEEFDTSLRKVIFSLTNFIQSITESEGALAAIRTTVQLVGVAIAGLTSRFAMMGLVSIYKNIIQFGRGLQLLRIQLMRATTAQAALNAVTKANPFVMVATVVGTLAGAYFLLGEEASEAARKQERLNKAVEDELTGVINLNAESKKRAASIRELKDAMTGNLLLMDIEVATNEELLELRDLMRKQADDKTELVRLEEEAALLERQRDHHLKFSKEKIAANVELIKSGSRYSKSLAKQNEMLRKEIDVNEKEAQDARKRAEDRRAQLDAELAATQAFQRLKLDGEKTFREQKRKFYDDELEDFRNMTFEEQKIFKEGAENKLNELTWITQYRDLVSKELNLTGEPLEQAKLNTQAFVDEVMKMGFDVTKATGDINLMNIEISVLEKFVSSLTSSMKTATKEVKEFSLAGFSLNKTKDQFKKLNQLFDDLLEERIAKQRKSVQQEFDIAMRANQEQLALMQTNTKNIQSFIDTGSKEEIAKLIQTNRNRFNVIKNLTAEEYQAAIDAENGNKDDMLAILDAMIAEEQQKIITAQDFEKQLLQNHLSNMKKLEIEAASADANLLSQEENLEADEMARRELSFFASLRKRNQATKDFAASQTAAINAEQTRQLTNLEALRKAEKITEQEFQDAKTRIVKQANIERMQVEKDAFEEQKENILAGLQKIQEYYTMAFDAFSTFFSNKMALERQKTEEFYELQSQDLNHAMQGELDAVEGNAEAEEDVRERYNMLQEVNEAKKQEELRKIKKKEFQVDKANNLIQAGISGAMALITTAGKIGFPAILAAAPILTGLIAAQIAAIASAKFVGAKGGLIPGADDKFADGGMVFGPSHANGGVKFAVGGRVAELEGGEAVINKRSTAMFKSQLSAINQAGGGVKFADGGIMPGTSNIIQSSSVTNQTQQFEELAANIVSGINSKEVVVTESAITNTQESVSVSELTSTFF